MKLNKCKIFGHKWKPVFIRGFYGKTEIKIIGAYCVRCRKGYDELMDMIVKQDKSVYGTYSEKYFDDPKYNKKMKLRDASQDMNRVNCKIKNVKSIVHGYIIKNESGDYLDGVWSWIGKYVVTNFNYLYIHNKEEIKNIKAECDTWTIKPTAKVKATHENGEIKIIGESEPF